MRNILLRILIPGPRAVGGLFQFSKLQRFTLVLLVQYTVCHHHGMNVEPSVNQRQSLSSITVSSTARGAAKKAIKIDLILTETVQQR